MREIDRLTTERYAIPSLILMETAAASAARALLCEFEGSFQNRTALVLCGRGNNGGDGAALSRILWTLGAKVDVILFGQIEDTKGDARTNFEILKRLGSFDAGSSEKPSGIAFIQCQQVAAWEEFAGRSRCYDVIVDALFGTGLSRPLEGIFRTVVEHLALLRRARKHSRNVRPLIVSLDVPSGLNADSPSLIGETVHADLTVTFTAPKPANVLAPASHLNGRLVVACIGSPQRLIADAPSNLFLSEAEDARLWLEKTRYAPDSYKNSHGHVLIIAGSRNYTGAPALCGNAALASGAGIVCVATPSSAQPSVAARLHPEAITAPVNESSDGVFNASSLRQLDELIKRATVVAIGPGLTADNEETQDLVRKIVADRATPIIIDADGLNSLAPWPADLRGTPAHPLILTPHEGEMRRLLGLKERNGLADRVLVAREFAMRNTLILVLKGARTLVAAPDGRVFVNPTGNAGLGRGGSGDTLTGVIASFVGQEFASRREDDIDPFAATVAAVYVSGLAADIAARKHGMRTLRATHVRENLGAAIRSLDMEGERP